MKFCDYMSLKDSSREYSSHLALLSSLNKYRSEQLGVDVEKFIGWKLFCIKDRFLIKVSNSSEESFVETIVAWLNKYEMKNALIRYKNDDTLWELTATGNRYIKGSWEKMANEEFEKE